ncbi:recombinase family protein [Shimia thalassica]|nr:recombinase family protein [Shimia thalassica]
MHVCKEHANRLGWTVRDVFSDKAISGSSMLRPGLQSLLREVQGGGVDIILAEALDRLSRDQADVAAIYKRLSFAGVSIVTLSEGKISELHVGLKGTMNQLFLKDLADKTRRGLRGRVEGGFSGGGNSYGYDVVHRLEPDGAPVTGERLINEEQASIIRRVFREFSDGQSPKAIALGLNAEDVPGPRGKLWRDTAIRGHRQRGTGLINNELYIGRLVWNRLRYLKDPDTGRRVSRLNPEADWIIKDVPHLRIVNDTLWQEVKDRQGEIAAEPRVQAIKATKFWEKRRKVHLLTGLAYCGQCGSRLSAVGKEYLACSAARKLGTCDQIKSVRRPILEDAVLNLLHNRFMQPKAVAEFVKAFSKEANARAGETETNRKRLQTERASTVRKLDGLYEAIADGLRTPGLKTKLEELESKVATLDTALEAPAPSRVRLHPNLSELYRQKVSTLSETLSDPEIRTRGLEVIRSLIERVSVTHEGEGIKLELEGALSTMIELAQPAKHPPRAGVSGDCVSSSVKVVAGVGFEPTTFRL